MARTRSHARDYIASLDNQTEQLFDHIPDVHVVVDHVFTWKNLIVRGGGKDYDPCDGECFVVLVQLPKAITTLNVLRGVAIDILVEANEVAMSERGKTNASTMASPEMMVAHGCDLGNLMAHAVGSSSNNHGHYLMVCPQCPMHLQSELPTIMHQGGISMIPHHFKIHVSIA